MMIFLLIALTCGGVSAVIAPQLKGTDKAGIVTQNRELVEKKRKQRKQEEE